MFSTPAAAAAATCRRQPPTGNQPPETARTPRRLCPSRDEGGRWVISHPDGFYDDTSFNFITFFIFFFLSQTPKLYPNRKFLTATACVGAKFQRKSDPGRVGIKRFNGVRFLNVFRSDFRFSANETNAVRPGHRSRNIPIKRFEVFVLVSISISSDKNRVFKNKKKIHTNIIYVY